MRISDGAIGNLSGDVEAKLKNFEVFETFVSRFCKTMAARTGLSDNFSSAKLREAHVLWLSECERWLSTGPMPSGTDELSHFKSFGILLFALSETEFISFRNTITPNPWQAIYGKLDFADDSQIKLFVDGQHYYIAWLFCYDLVEAYERDRTDRRTSYSSRITEDFELDMISHLISGNYTSDSLYMVMKALFFRE